MTDGGGWLGDASRPTILKLRLCNRLNLKLRVGGYLFRQRNSAFTKPSSPTFLMGGGVTCSTIGPNLYLSRFFTICIELTPQLNWIIGRRMKPSHVDICLSGHCSIMPSRPNVRNVVVSEQTAFDTPAIAVVRMCPRRLVWRNRSSQHFRTVALNLFQGPFLPTHVRLRQRNGC